MKSIFVLPLIVIAIVAATILHQFKSLDYADDAAIEKLAGSLKDIKHSLPANNNIHLNITGLNSEVYLWGRYLLSPCYCSIEKNDKLDTVLAICRINASDSIVNTIVMNRNIIWSNRDDQYQCYLTAKK